jgi:hypothetical protein
MLTAAQRLHFDLRGYVLLKGLFTAEECAVAIGVAHAMKRSSPYPRQDSARQSVLFGPAFHDRRILALAMDTRLRPAAEEIVGGESRLEENEFLITASGGESTGDRGYRWHRGLAPAWGSFASAAGYHCLFTKAIVYLTPRGRATGTFVIPGSHRQELRLDELQRLVTPDLYAYVDAEPGDVLLFGETLVHSSPAEAPDAERILLVLAFSAPFMKTWSADTDPPAILPYETTAEERRFIYGEGRYDFRAHGR